MTTGLPVSGLINYQVTLSPNLPSTPSEQVLLILGDSPVIDVGSRFREYADLQEVAADFGINAPEYKAAARWFGQKPSPTILYIGRWALVATPGLMLGGDLTPTQQALSNFTGITTGSFAVTVDGGAVKQITALNFSAAGSLPAVAADITTALATAAAGATCQWDGQRFVIKSSTTGAASSVSAPAAPAAGVDVRSILGWAAGLPTLVGGIAAESPVTAVELLDGLSADWYGVSFAASTQPTTSQYQDVATYIEAGFHAFGITTQDVQALNPASSTDVAYVMSALGFDRTTVQYSSQDPYAVCSMLGRLLTVDFNGNATTITLMYKQEPGITSEVLTPTQAAALAAKNCNVFVAYNNSTSIIQYGTMASGIFCDDLTGFDWLKADIVTSVFDALYGSPTKIPQDDDGNHQLATVIDASCQQGVKNGLIGPGVWDFDGFGTLKTGDTLQDGYYIFQPPVSSQPLADRTKRASVVFQIAVISAGAIHTSAGLITVSR